MPLFDALAIAPEAMRVDVTIAVQEPDALDTAAVKACVPWGTVSVQAVPGGLNVTDPRTGRTIVIATAAVQAFLAPQEGWRLV
jgi:uncharacterized protein (TIGR02058 family)